MREPSRPAAIVASPGVSYNGGCDTSMFNLRNRERMVRIVLGVVLGFVSLGMLLYLVPMPNAPLEAGTEGLADVAGERITVSDVRRQMALLGRQQPIPQQLRGLYAQQIFDQMVFQRLLAVEASRLGIGVSDDELARAVQEVLPEAFAGGRPVSPEQYAALVQQRFGMDVPSFERELRQSLLERKFRRLVTAGITVTPDEVRDEFRRRNEKVRIEYVLLDPAALRARIHPTEAELRAYYEAHRSSYQVPEQRAARYLLVSLDRLRKSTQISEDDLRALYQQQIDRYRVPERVHVQHILFMTVGKTDAEIAEIQKKAERVLSELRHGADFATLARQYSDDPGSRDRGGDLGWIVRGQTVPEFEKVAFSLSPGSISDLVRTAYGFHILRVVAHEQAHTESFEQARASLEQTLLADRVEREAEQAADRLADRVRQSNRQPLENLLGALEGPARAAAELGETPLVAVNQPIAGLGNSRDLEDALFGLSVGQLSEPIRVESGYVVLSVTKIVPAHAGSYEEVRDRVQDDYLREKSAELARALAQELYQQCRQGAPLQRAAAARQLEDKTGEFTRTDSIQGIGPAQTLAAAFRLQAGQLAEPVAVGQSWVVYRVLERIEPPAEEFARQKDTIAEELLAARQAAAFEAFRRSLEDQMKREGKLRINTENLKRLTASG